MSEGQATKKRKVEEVEDHGSEGHYTGGEDHTMSESSTTEHNGHDGPSGSTITEHEREVQQLRQALSAADDAVRQAKLARRALAERLAAIGEPVVVDPLCEAFLQVKMEQLRAEFEEEFEDFEDAAPADLPDAAKWPITRVVRMMAALRQGCQFDREGYLDPAGRWVSFKPSDDELAAITWRDLEEYWELQ